jgi:hypothetical protein
MPKTGRNDPCPCASGKKYKRCCMAQDQARQQLALAAKGAHLQAQAAQHSSMLGDVRAALLKGLQELQEPDELDNDSNAVIDLIKAGQSTRPSVPPANCWFAIPMSMMAMTAWEWSTRLAACLAKPPGATARWSNLCAPTRTTTTPSLCRSLLNSSPVWIHRPVAVDRRHNITATSANHDYQSNKLAILAVLHSGLILNGCLASAKRVSP